MFIEETKDEFTDFKEEEVIFRSFYYQWKVCLVSITKGWFSSFNVVGNKTVIFNLFRLFPLKNYTI